MNIFALIASINWVIFLPIFISLLALLVSIINFWIATLSKFKPVFSVGDLRLRIYPIRSGKEKWFIASIDLPLSVANDGARSGRISDIRVIAKYPKLPIPNHWEVFLPRWDIDSVKFRQSELKDRFRWIQDAALCEWMPFIVLSKQTVSKHLIFETKWDKPVIQEKISFTLEIKRDNRKKWERVDSWELSLAKEIWSELAEVGTSLGTPSQSKLATSEKLTNPSDLHKYTLPDGPIPHGGFKAKPSYMNYPKTKGEH